jgi:hypothetical protein
MAKPTRNRAANDPQQQRDALLDSERAANQDEPRNFKEDALTAKKVEVEPDGTGPTPTETFDAPQDRQQRHSPQRKRAAKKPPR